MLLRYKDGLALRLKEGSQLTDISILQSTVIDSMSTFSNTDRNYILKVLEFVSHTNYTHGGDMHYAIHPLRVAILCKQLCAFWDKSILALALTHNIIESSAYSNKELLEFIEQETIDNIKILTVDRKQEKNKKYKYRYYQDIALQGKFCACVKVIDKLDNIFLLPLNPDEAVREWYLDEIENLVIPLARSYKREMPAVHTYMADLLHDARQTGFVSVTNLSENSL